MRAWANILGTVSLLCIAVMPSVVNAGPAVSSEKINLVGDDFSAWRPDTGQWQIVGDVFKKPDNEKLLDSKQGKGIVVNGPTGRTSHLLSKAEFGDVTAHIEFMVPRESNSGVYFMGRYEIQVLDSWQKESDYAGNECGGIYQRWDDNRTPQGYEGHSPRVNVSKPPGEWQTFDVVFRAPRFDSEGRKISNARFEKVIHNNVVVHEDVEVTGPTRASAYNDEKPTGPLVLQGDHGPVAYRNIRLAPAGPNPFFAMDTGTKDDKHQTAKEQVEMIKKLGYDGIGPTGDAGLAEMVQELDKNNLRCFAVYMGVNIDPNQQKYDPKLKEAMEILKGRNTILWLFVLSQKHKPSSPEGDARAVEIIREIADMAAQYKLRVALYPHYGFWVERVEDALRVVKKVDRKNVGVTFNLCHWLRVDDEKNMQLLIKAAMPYLFVVTINGADGGGKDWKQLIQTLDRGSFDMHRFLKTLKDSGYTGPIGLQGYGIGGDANDNLKRSMSAWRQQLSERLQAGKN
jgi:sugar phosphate isomerase/epimerase